MLELQRHTLMRLLMTSARHGVGKEEEMNEKSRNDMAMQLDALIVRMRSAPVDSVARTNVDQSAAWFIERYGMDLQELIGSVPAVERYAMSLRAALDALELAVLAVDGRNNPETLAEISAAYELLRAELPA